MNISSEIPPTAILFYNSTLLDLSLNILVLLIAGLLVLPVNAYTIWLIATGTGNGLSAEFFHLNLSISQTLFTFYFTLYFVNFTSWWLYAAMTTLLGLAITACPVFQCLMCVECYLAVVHPIMFLKLKPLRYRLICSSSVWLFTIVISALTAVALAKSSLGFLIVLVLVGLSFSVQMFCLVSVLRTLKQSGPGERGREEENLMKKRAFHIITTISVTLLIAYVPYILSIVLLLNSIRINMIGHMSDACFELAALVQPCLFLRRVRRFPCVKNQ